MICEKFPACIRYDHSDTSERCKDCREVRTDRNISCSENGKSYNLINDKRLTVIDFLIDGGVFVHDTAFSRCDRMYYIDDPKLPTTIFIELKGRKVEQALKQIYDTAIRCKSAFLGKRCFFRIVCSGAPKIGNDKGCIDIKRKFQKQFGYMPLIREKRIDEIYSKL